MSESEPAQPQVTIYHDGSWSSEELNRMAKGKFIDRNGHRYTMCGGCHTIVCVDKRFFGSFHICRPQR